MDVDADYMATNMVALVCGNSNLNTDEFNTCDKSNIAGPDNVAYVLGHDALIIGARQAALILRALLPPMPALQLGTAYGCVRCVIVLLACNCRGIRTRRAPALPNRLRLPAGEDTDEHQNDAMWYYDFKDGSLTRFLTTPYGSETTSPYWYPNINGWAYLTAVVQHPYGESDEDQMCVVPLCRIELSRSNRPHCCLCWGRMLNCDRTSCHLSVRKAGVASRGGCLTAMRCACSDDPKATGVAGYTGYVGPFKAHPDSVNMAEPPTGDYLWNGFPNLGLHGDGAMGGYGDSGDSVVAIGGGDDVEGEPLMSTAEGTSPDVDSGAEAGDPEATSAESR